MDSNHRSLVSKTSGLSQAFPHSAIAPFEIHSHKVGISKYLFCAIDRGALSTLYIYPCRRIATFMHNLYQKQQTIKAYQKCMVKKLAKFGLHCFPIMRY